MARMGNAGRTRSTGLQKKVQAMAALKEYRLECAIGTVQMAPKDVFLHDKGKWILE